MSNYNDIDFRHDMPDYTGKELEKFNSCRWMIDKDYNTFNLSNSERRKLARWWYKQFYKHLPSDKLIRLSDMGGLSFFSLLFNIDEIEQELKKIRFDIVNELLRMEYYKEKYLNEQKEKESKSYYSQNANRLATLKEYRFHKLTERFERGTPEYEKQKNEKINGYYPTMEILRTQEPIEIIEYCGFTLTKYDKLHGYFSITIETPNKEIILNYNENPNDLESNMENKFDTMIDDYLKEKQNPYGNKSFLDNQNKDIDISNILNVMDCGDDKNNISDDDDPLNNDIF